MALQVNDRVGYSAAFGRNVGLDGNAMNARGVIKEIQNFGSISLAIIAWEGGSDNPTKVALPNLAKVGTAKFVDCHA